MRDDSRNWKVVECEVNISGSEVTLERVRPSRQTLVSGVAALTHFEDTLGTAVGWPEAAQGSSYAVALRRDRVLLVNGPALDCGWHDHPELAVTDMTGGYTVFDLCGADALQVVKRGTAINPDLPSRSAARIFGGLGVILYHISNQERFRFHVGSAYVPAFVQTVQSYMGKLE
ncbi:MAG: hypothetical protein V2I51_13240 [Anderseniella sp.]|nr:hypothetical protein [Anderseniella sp.]